MLTASLLLLLPYLAGVAASPVALQKRWNTCWGYNPDGCPFGDVGQHGAVATEVGTCSAIGVQIMKDGGNAADAMIASALCVGMIGGFHSGIGGGGFMVVRYNNDDGSHGYEQIDFRETMPAAGTETMFSSLGVNQTASTVGGLAIGVPGELRAWEMLHKRHGSLPWAKLFEPAIDVATKGFPVNSDLAYFLSTSKWILNSTLWSEVYAPNGQLAVEGDYLYQPRLAKTLRAIADNGPDYFYQDSPMADNIVKAVKDAGGIMTHDDLRGYKAILRNTSKITYRGKTIHSTTAPSSGAIVLSALKIYEGFDGSAQVGDEGFNLSTHHIVEATKFAYGQRSTLGDPGFTHNVSSLEAGYLTDEVADAARARIMDDKANVPAYYNPSTYDSSPPEGGTSHLAVVDGSGMAISLTTTVNLIFGSRVMTEDGIVLNNEMDDFSSPGQVNAFGFAANPINFIRGGKRPQSSIASSLVEDEDGRLLMATGSAGGSRIITATLQQLHNYIDKGMNASASAAEPRWHDQLSGKCYFDFSAFTRPLPEYGFDNRTTAFMKDLGHNVTFQDPYSTSTSHAITRLADGGWLAASDPRKPAGRGQAF